MAYKRGWAHEIHTGRDAGQKLAHAQSADARGEKTHKHETHLHAQIQPAEHRRRKRRRKRTRETFFARRFAVPVPK